MNSKEEDRRKKKREMQTEFEGTEIPVEDGKLNFQLLKNEWTKDEQDIEYKSLLFDHISLYLLYRNKISFSHEQM